MKQYLVKNIVDDCLQAGGGIHRHPPQKRDTRFSDFQYKSFLIRLLEKQHLLKMVSNECKMDINISETIDKLKNEKRIIAKKVLELSNAVKNSFSKIQKTLACRILSIALLLPSLRGREKVVLLF